MESLLYAFGLSLLCFLLFHIHGFVHFCRSSRKRKQMMEKPILEWRDFPEPESLAEEDYQEMITLLQNRCQHLATEWETRQQDSLDYYTTWVHQIKTPISVMQMQLQAEDTKEHRELLAELFRIEQYVEMVLNYIRLDSDTNDLVLQEQDVDEMIRGVIRKFAPQFIRRKLKLVYEPVEKTYITDAKWFSFILEQLISNAVKYTIEGGITISLSQDKNVLSIGDTGIGIAPEDLPRIFEKGYTGYQGRTDKKATGLGLYLCKQAADKIGIRLRAESVPGTGSVFYMELVQQNRETE
jgi:hypothetical protein